MKIHKLQQTTSQDEHLQHLKDHSMPGLSENRDQIPQDMRTYWIFWDDMAVIDWIIPRGRCIVIPETLQRWPLQQLHVNHMGIERTKLLVHKSIYYIGMNVDIENHIKMTLHVLIFSKCSKRKKKHSQCNSGQTMESSWSGHVYPTQ